MLARLTIDVYRCVIQLMCKLQLQLFQVQASGHFCPLPAPKLRLRQSCEPCSQPRGAAIQAASWLVPAALTVPEHSTAQANGILAAIVAAACAAATSVPRVGTPSARRSGRTAAYAAARGGRSCAASARSAPGAACPRSPHRPVPSRPASQSTGPAGTCTVVCSISCKCLRGRRRTINLDLGLINPTCSTARAASVARQPAGSARALVVSPSSVDMQRIKHEFHQHGRVRCLHMPLSSEPWCALARVPGWSSTSGSSAAGVAPERAAGAQHPVGHPVVGVARVVRTQHLPAVAPAVVWQKPHVTQHAHVPRACPKRPLGLHNPALQLIKITHSSHG